MGHAVFCECRGYLFAEVAFAVDVEDGADVGNLVGKEREGVFLLLVDGIEGVTLNALAVGSVVDAQRTGLAAIDAIPGDREHARVAVGGRCVIGVI